MKHSARFTLIEIAIAIAVFAIGILTAMAILVPSVRWGADAKTDFTAAEAALNLMQTANNTGVVGIDGIYQGPGTATQTQFYPYVAAFFSPDTATTPRATIPDNLEMEGVVKVYRKLPVSPFGEAETNNLAQYQNPSSIASDMVVSQGGAPQVIFAMKVNLLYQLP
ncbi:hypothetical protein AGMMS49959_09670 [Planctomycetales bacterium]|nr:hypothetical protein AGMMS49959_09670 [Planctomycetales bacterium]